MLPAAVLATLLAVAPSAGAAVVEETVTAGDVTATLSYDKSRDGTHRDFRVKIVKAGGTLVDEAIRKGCDLCFPANSGAGEKSIKAVDLDRDGLVEVVADVFSGGAHCCTVSLVFAYDEVAGDYVRVEQDWLDAGYRLRDIGRDGTLEFDSRDARFAYAFSSYAESFLPVMILRWRDGKFVDVTSRFRKLLRRDAKRALRTFRKYRGDPQGVNPRGFMAGWVANKYRLGERRSANRALRRALRRGDLARGGSQGRGFVRQLKRFLRKLGY